MADYISRQTVINVILENRKVQWKKSCAAEVEHKSVTRSKHDAHVGFCDYLLEIIENLPSEKPDKDMIHLQKEQAYLKGWEDGRKALREKMWEDERDRLY